MVLAPSCNISVFETTLTIQQNTLSVFNVILQTPESSVSLIRYPFDFIEFHHKILLYHPKPKITFPTLSNPSKKSDSYGCHFFRGWFSCKKKKSNAIKLEKYLKSCFQHPIVSKSSILQDFTRVQREEDHIVVSQSTFTRVAPSSHSHPNELKIKPSNEHELTLDSFSLLKVLGKGCMGKVLLVRSKENNNLYALKVMKKKRIIQHKEVAHIIAERDILIRLRNQAFIANTYCIFQTTFDICLVLEYYPGGDLATRLFNGSAFSKEEVLFFSAEILQGLDTLHQHGIIYRDLKPENVVIGQNGHIVLTDFGLSKLFSESDLNDLKTPFTQTFCGTAEYLAPEVLLGEPYTYAVDFWSLGTLLYEMVTGTVSLKNK
ncbi:kinase-like domain-containing protein [Blakeslea trispora]|nr:kinase-like domain-containing protein [Blakeslea trispora]